jgi:HK97 family phage prohead protease
MGDTIDPKGWNLHQFEDNPVCLWSHDSSTPSIGRASRVLIENERLMGDVSFAPPETFEFADTIYKLLLGKYLNAVSVGFIPEKYTFSEDDDRKWGVDYKSQSLLEISVCSIPANPRALIDARAKGIDTRPLVEWAERTLDGGGKVIVPKAEIERLRKAAKEPASTRPRRRADDGGMSETDPASGGAVVATCGRSMDDECGMTNPQECSVHMATEEDKRLADTIAKAVAAGVAAALKKGQPASRRRRAGKPRRREAGEGDGYEMKPEHAECIQGAMEHLKAMGDSLDDAVDHHEKAMDLVGSVCDDLDIDPEDEHGDDSSSADERAVRDLRRAAAAARRASAA